VALISRLCALDTWLVRSRLTARGRRDLRHERQPARLADAAEQRDIAAVDALDQPPDERGA